MKKIDALLENYEKSKLEKVSVIHANENGPTVVAFVYVDKEKTDADKLEEAFMLTNNIDCGWWENASVEKMFDGNACRKVFNRSLRDKNLNSMYKIWPLVQATIFKEKWSKL